MTNLFRKWFEYLNEVERGLRDQGYISVYGGATSLVICTRSQQSNSARRVDRPGERLRQAFEV
jgi:hypothetical protein